MSAGAVPVWRSRPYLIDAVIAGCCIEAAMVWRFGWSSALPAYLVLAAVGATASVIDIRTRRIPTALLLPAHPVVMALLAVASGAGPGWWPLGRAVLAAVLVSGFYLVLALGFPGQLGLADVRLGGLLGLGLGWLGWSAVVLGVLAGWLGAALLLLACPPARQHGTHRGIPLGPFLLAGALVGILAVR